MNTKREIDAVTLRNFRPDFMAIAETKFDDAVVDGVCSDIQKQLTVLFGTAKQTDVIKEEKDMNSFG